MNLENTEKMKGRSIDIDKIPYEKFKSIGLSKEDILNILLDNEASITKGGLSPLITLSHKDSTFKGKFSLVNNPNGSVDIYVYPKFKKVVDDKNLSQSEKDNLLEGKVIQKHNKEKNQVELLQIDNETNCLLSLPIKNLYIPRFIDNIELGQKHIDAIKKGNPITIKKDNTEITCGVDLRNSNSFKVLKGDLKEWDQKRKEEWDRITPGACQFLKTEENRKEYQAYKMKL